MELSDGQSIWTRTSGPAALVLVVDSAHNGIWGDPTDGLLAEVASLLPEVHVSWATTKESRSLEIALAAAAFLGAQSAVVIRLWDRHPHFLDPFQGPTEVGRMKVDYAVAPPDAGVVVAAYCAAECDAPANVRLAS